MAEGQKEEYRILKEGINEILYIDASRWGYIPSIEDNGEVMGLVIDALTNNPAIAIINIFLKN